MSMLKKITLVMDNLNTHTPGSLYETFIPAQAKEILERFEFVYIRQSMEVGLIWREIGLNVLIRQCLSHRIGNIEQMRRRKWVVSKYKRNNLGAMIDWQFTTDQAGIKVKTALSGI